MFFVQAYIVILITVQKIRGWFLFSNSSFLNKGYHLYEKKFDIKVDNQIIFKGNWSEINDVRFFGAQYYNKSVNEFHNDLNLYKCFRDLGVLVSLRNETTLFGNLTYIEGVVNGSGGGWHIDSWSFQPKAMSYLSDVGPMNGPFQYVEGSHKFIVQLYLFFNFKFRHNTRIDNELVQRVIKIFPWCRIVEFNGSKGTTILFDPRGIHRGMPIKEGFRVALTNYYVPKILPPTSIGEIDLKAKTNAGQFN